MGVKPKFFADALSFRAWLETNSSGASELLVGFFKTGSGKASMSWPESVDEALCFGWIDGVRRRVDETSYTIRFTPRKRGSVWSAVNIRKAASLTKQGRMRPAGRAAFEGRRENRSGVYSYEQRPAGLTGPYADLLAKNRTARSFFAAQTPSYRRAASWWVLSAKREDTRLKRARALVDLSAQGQLIPQFLRTPKR
jgi:uncharacterized protein YdeI (YjbR/CyaY-like superfamily)